MKIKIGIFGSYISKDIFDHELNDYKKYFEIVYSLDKISVISLMAKKHSIKFSPEDVQIYPLDDQNKSRSAILECDLSNDYLSQMGNNIDYLIIDEFFEAYLGVIKINDTYITNNYLDYQDTQFYETIKNNNVLNLNNNFMEYYVLWRDSCDRFFNYFHENFPNVKIILNKIKLTSEILNYDYYYVDEEFQKKLEIYNPLIKLLENYLEKYHDVLIVDCTRDMYVNENYMYDKNMVLSPNKFYINAFEKILELTKENQFNVRKAIPSLNSKLIKPNFKFNYENFNELPLEGSLDEFFQIKKFLFEEASIDNNFIDPFRLKDYLKYISKNNLDTVDYNFQESSFYELIKLNRFVSENKECLEKETRYIENKINSNYFNENAEFLIKYIESRIDIKNHGDKNNKIIILNSHSNFNSTQPSWFDDETGKGMVVRSVKGELDLSFKCVNGGKLCIEFKGIDYSDKNGNRIPIYIDYEKIVINNEILVNESYVACHDSPIIFEKEVDDGDIINIKSKWNPVNYKSNFLLKTDYEKLVENFYKARIDVKNKGNVENDLILIDCNDSLSNIEKPNWFKSTNGSGTVVTSSCENIELSFKCINEGILEIDFRAIDFIDNSNNRIPIFIEYTKIKVNDKNIIGNNFISCHDDPFVYKQKVKDGEIINIQAKWNTLNPESNSPLI